MDAKELRIGNWVNHSNSPRWIDEAKNTPIQVDIGVLSNIQYYESIPISPEILEKCGFVKEVHDISIDFYGYRQDNMILYKVRDNGRSGDWFYEVEFNSISYEERVPISSKLYHLHQLQNLYFALTQTELNIKL